MRYAIVLLTACVVGCSSQARDIGVGPTPTLTTAGLSGIAPIGDADVSCSDRAPIWVTPAYSTSHGYLQGEWTPVLNIDTYQVEISYSRDGIEPWRVVSVFDTNRTEFRYVDRESGGRYRVHVRVKNRCDVAGEWSTQLSVILGGGSEDPAPPQEYYLD
jgi:hypothetical protein